MRTILAEDLESEIEAMDSWWREHREKAPNLFAEELADAFEWIEAQPKSYPVYKETSRGIVRRAPMPTTRNHVYYVLRETEGSSSSAELPLEAVRIWAENEAPER